jgi:hypothetical protein
MTIRANADNKFLLKFLLIGLGCAAFGGWAVKDIVLKGPKDIEIATAWEKLKNDESLDDAERDKRYKVIAKEKGWPSKRPGKSLKDARDFMVWNYAFAAIGLGVGLPCLFWWVRNRGIWIEAEGDTVRSSRGQEFTIEQVTQFDKKKWEKKGIGVVTYQADGVPKNFVVDDLKYSRSEMDEIVRLIEEKIPAEMIVGGAPESVEAGS